MIKRYQYPVAVALYAVLALSSLVSSQIVKAQNQSAPAQNESAQSEAELPAQKDQTTTDSDQVAGVVKGLPQSGGDEDAGSVPVPLQEAGDPAEQAAMGVSPASSAGRDALEHYDLSRFYFSHWQLGLAEIELETTIMFAPNMKIAHRDYCVISLLRGHPFRAMAEAAMVFGLGDAIPLNEQERQDLMQRASKVHYREGLKQARARHWDAALSELQWAQAYTPNKPAVARSMAFCYASKGDFGKAETIYTTTLALDPDDAFTHADFAYLLADHGQSDRAEGQLSQALKLAPDAAALHVDLGWLAETKGDFKTAQDELNTAIKLCPSQPGLWLQLGHVLERAGKKVEAQGAYEKVLSLDSTEEEARQRLQALKSTPAESAAAAKKG